MKIVTTVNQNLSYRVPSQLTNTIFVVFALLLAVLVNAANLVAPAGAKIGNTGAITFDDANGQTHTVTSNNVTIEVLQVYSVLLETDRNSPAVAGETVTFPHSITNTGNGDDSFNLAALNVTGADDLDYTSIEIYPDDGTGNPVLGTPITATDVLEAGETFNFVIVATLPNGTDGQTAILTIDATSVGDSGEVARNTDTATLSSNAVIKVSKSVTPDKASPGTTGNVFSFLIENTGGATATNVSITDVLDSAFVYTAGSGRWNGSANDLTDEDDIESGIAYQYNDSTGTVEFTINSIAPDEPQTVTFEFSIDDDALAGPATNKVDVSYDDGSGNTVDDQSNEVIFTVDQVANPDANDSNPDGTITADEDGVPGDDKVEKDQAAPGETIYFENIITNSGNGNDTFDIELQSENSSFPEGTQYALYKADGATPLLNTNDNALLDTGVLSPGETFVVVLAVTLPDNAAGNNNGAGFVISKTAISAFDPSQIDTVTDQLNSIASHDVDLTFDISVNNNATAAEGLGKGPEDTPVRTNTGSAGEVTTFNLHVNNTGAGTDNYSLNEPSAPSAWPILYYLDDGDGIRNDADIALTDDKTGPIAASDSALIFVDVAVPAGTEAGAYDLQIKANSSITASEDTISARVVIGETHDVVLAPLSQQGSTIAGGKETYAHTLTNNGNVDEQLTLDISNSENGWQQTVYIDTNGNGVLDAEDVAIDISQPIDLPAGETLSILVEVSAPDDAQQNDSNQTTIAVSYNGGQSATDPAIDTTTINAGFASIEKTQAADLDCDGEADGLSFTDQNLQVKPGQCAIYRLIATNTGDVAIRNVKISDTTPEFTQHFRCGGSCGASVSVGSITAEPAEAESGEVKATIDELAAGSTATLQFVIKLND